MLERRHLSDLLLELQHWTNFLGGFTRLSSGRPITEEDTAEKVKLLTCLIAEGCNIGFSDMSIIGNTGVFIGDATLNGVGKRKFRVTVVDNGEPGRNDQFGLQVTAPGGAIIPDLTFDPITLTGNQTTSSLQS
jgi:Tn3 transposase DDE domain